MHEAPVTDNPVRFDEAIRAFRERVPMTRDEWDTLEADEQDFAFTVSAVAQADIVEQVWNALDSAIEHGDTLEDFKDSIRQALYDAWGEPDGARVETIFRTNVNQAYNDGREEIFSDPAVADERPIWRYELIADGDLCEICEECDGVILPADDPWWDEHRPIQHPRCRCSFAALTLEEARAEGYDGGGDDGPDVQTADGFGDGEEWEPSGADYPSPIGDHLDDVLEQ